MQSVWNRAVSVWLRQAWGLLARRAQGQACASVSAAALLRSAAAESNPELFAASVSGPPLREPAFVWACAAMLGLCLWLALRYAPALGFYSPDCALKWLQLKSLRFEDGALITSLHYPGRSFDPQLHAVPLGGSFFTVRNGQIELVWPPWFALLSWPFQRVLGPSGMRVLPAVSACACGLFSALLVGVRARTFALLVAVLASPVIVYGMLAWEHAIASALVCCSVWLWLAPPRAAARTALAGMALALACAMRAELWVLCAALLMAALVAGGAERRAGVSLGLWLGGGSLPFALWTFQHSEHALPANAMRNFSHASLDYLRKTGADVLAVFSWGSADALAWLGVASALALLVSAAVSSSALAARGGEVTRTLERIRGVCLGLYALVSALLVGRRLAAEVDTLHGLLESAPWLLIAIAAVPGWSAQHSDGTQRRARLLRLTLSAYVLLYLLSISLFSWSGPNGGREWGPRFILPVYPLAAPLLVLGWRQNRAAARWLRHTYAGTLVLCVSLSLALHAKGLWLVQRAEQLQASQAQQLLAMPADTLFVALEWWMPTLLAPQFESRSTFWIQDPLAWNEVLGRAACADRGEVWLAGMVLPDRDSVRALTLPQLDLEQHSEVGLAGLVLRSLSARPHTPELCSYLATHAVSYPPRR